MVQGGITEPSASNSGLANQRLTSLWLNNRFRHGHRTPHRISPGVSARSYGKKFGGFCFVLYCFSLQLLNAGIYICGASRPPHGEDSGHKVTVQERIKKRGISQRNRGQY